MLLFVAWSILLHASFFNTLLRGSMTRSYTAFYLIGDLFMSNKAKADLIQLIVWNLKQAAKRKDTAFDEGSVFFKLCFLSDTQLKKIAKEVGV